MTTNQSFETWKDMPDYPVFRAAQLTGTAAVGAEVPMGPDNPHYEEWLEHVDNQPHQGC